MILEFPRADNFESRSARGNSSLESAVSLTKALRYDIQQLGQRLANAASQSENKLRKRTKEDIKAVIDDIRNMLNRIEDVRIHRTSAEYRTNPS